MVLGLVVLLLLPRPPQLSLLGHEDGRFRADGRGGSPVAVAIVGPAKTLDLRSQFAGHGVSIHETSGKKGTEGNVIKVYCGREKRAVVVVFGVVSWILLFFFSLQI